MKQAQGEFAGQGGLRIHHQSWTPPRPRASVVIAHGVGEHGGRYAHVAQALVAAGFDVHAIDHRGHGRSDGPRACVDRWRNAVADIDQLVDRVRGKRSTRPLFLLGHSMGGALSLAYATLHQHKLRALAVSAPAVALDGAPPLSGVIAKALSRFVPQLGTFGIKPELVSRDPEAAANYAADPLNCHGKLPIRTLAEIVLMTEYLPGALPKVTLPLLIQHGTADKLAGVSGSRRVMQRVASADKTLLTYDGLYHEIFNEIPADRKAVLADLVGWLGARV